MGGRGASFGGGSQSSGNRYGNQYNATEVLMFSELEETLGIGDNDRDAVRLMLNNYDEFRQTNTEAIAGHNVERAWNETVVSALNDQGIPVDRTNFLTSEDDYPTFTGIYNDVQSTNGITQVTMTKNKGDQSIRYEFDDVAVTKDLSDNSYHVTHEDGTTATFSSLAQAKADAKKNGERIALPF